MSRNNRLRLRWYIVAASSLILIPQTKTLAQSNIVPDNTLGNKSSIVTSDPNNALIEQITGGAQRGQNLFHSFEEFNIGEGSAVYFVSPNTDIANILSRVTGNNVSKIFGTLGTSGASQPDLFLINPNGIIFGENASLDVGGSFVATTADSIQFGEEGFFSASEPETPPLLTVQPSAFFFNQVNPGGTITNLSIANNTTLGFAVNGESDRPIRGLQVLDSQSLLFLARDINIDGGFLSAPGGRIELNTAAETSTVNLNFSEANLTLEQTEDLSTGNVFIGNSSLLDTVQNIGDGGDIEIDAGNIIIANNTRLESSVTQQGNAGSISLVANDNVSVDNSLINSNLGSSAGNMATGSVGNIAIAAKNISFSNIAQLQAGLFLGAAGEPGLISVAAEDTITGVNTGIFANTDPGSIGNGSNVELSANSIFLNQGIIQASSGGKGTGGNISLVANEDVSVDNSLINSNLGSSAGNTATGSVGDIAIAAKNISFSNTAQLQAGLFLGAIGEPGLISVTAEDSISISGVNTGIFANTDPGSIGNGSDVELSANSILLNQGTIQASSAGEGIGGNITLDSNILSLDNTSFMSTSTLGTGRAGNITIDVSNLFTSNGSSISSATSPTSTGEGGNITVTASESILLTGTQINSENIILESGITSQTQGTGNGGDISVTTGKLTILEGAAINANAIFSDSGRAGNVSVVASDSIEVIGGTEFTPSSISVDTSSFQNAGDLDITTTNTLIVRDGGQISAATFAGGNGGSLTLNAIEVEIAGTADNENMSPSGLFSSVEFGASGNSGNLNITADKLSITDSARASVSSSGSGRAGNIDIQSSELTLNRDALINAQTLTTDGGNINLQITDSITLDNNSNISATAGTAEAGGDGGNIDIDTEFIVAYPNGSNDITANAFEGAGGNIEILAESLFGIESRPSTPPNSTNDIDASSQFGLDGEISIETPDVDPARGLDNLPTNVVDASQLISRNCLDGDEQQLNEFVVTGRGGLPTNPSQTLSGKVIPSAEWVSLPEMNIAEKSVSDDAMVSVSNNRVVEAQGWRVKPDGTIVLVADSNTSSMAVLPLDSYSCDD